MKRLLLVGAGHAHLKLLSVYKKNPLYGARITLVSPRERQVYSGMLPGVVAGHYRRAEAEIDVAALCEKAYAEFVPGAIARLDLAARSAVLEDGRSIGYDYVCLNMGSRIDTSVAGAERALAAKPFEPFLERLGDARRIAVIGAGAAGAELAMALRFRGSAVTLYSGSRSMPEPLASHAARALRRADVDFRASMAADSIEPGPVIRAGSSIQEFDQVILATGAIALGWPRDSGLQCDERGFIAVHPTLQSRSHPEVFAAGDCAALDAPKSGVYALRAGETLARSFANLVRGEPPAEFVPQRRALILLSCGAKRAIAQRGSWAAQGAWAWQWKNWIDRRWLRTLG